MLCKKFFDQKKILSLVKQYDCPIWIYSAEIIKSKIDLLNKFDIVRYAQKACSNIHILKFLRKYGIKIDAVSFGEIKRALVAGYKPHTDIVFTADLFEKKTLEVVSKLRIPVNIGSMDMIHQLGIISSGHSVWLRINPGFGHGHSQKTNTGGKYSKHGIWHTELNLALKKMKKYNLHFIGLHMHIGSGVDYKHLKKVCDAMVYNISQSDCDVQFISAGGGLSIPYHHKDIPVNTANYYDLWNAARKKIEKHLGHKIKLEIEPGRFLIGESGILVSQVCAIKVIECHQFILVNVGFNDLMRPVMYGSYHRISIIANDDRIIDYEKTEKSIVAGPLCESGDIFTQLEYGKIKPRNLPKVKIGDYLIFHDTGAYGASMSSNYNTRPLLPEILLEKEYAKMIRRRQTVQDLLTLEIFE